MKKIMEFLKSKRIQLSLPISLILVVGASFALTLFMFFLQPDGVWDMIKSILDNKGISLLLNWLPLLILMVILFFSLNSAVISISAVGALGILMSVVNRYKILLRDDPFRPWDISLGREVMGIAKGFGASIVIISVILIMVYVAVSVFLAQRVKSEKINPYIRIGVSTACIAFGIFINKPLYGNLEINTNLYDPDISYNQSAVFNSSGFLYSFIYTYNMDKISKPENYDGALVRAQIEKFETDNIQSLSEKQKPHIIMIMGEAFCEMSLNEHFDFTNYVDPLKNYKTIKEESIYGNIVVPSLGGGTSDTEFDVLTGLTTRHLRGIPYSYKLISGEFEALPSVLSKIGYRSEAIHPGSAWFYNRQNVYGYFGFEKSEFVSSFEGAEEIAYFISETATIDRVIELFEANKKDFPDTPYFNFTVTIQNHRPYKDKYGVGTNFHSDIWLESDDKNTISNYFKGVSDADRELGRLVDYFRKENEPVVLIYFGDHLPGFSNDVFNAFYPDIYDGDGSLEDIIRLYKTPFIIWRNDAAKEISDIDENFEKAVMPENMTVSSNFLGAYVLELLGYKGISPFMDYCNETRATYPIVLEDQSFTPSGKSTAYMTDEEKLDLVVYRYWEFYKIFGD